MRDPDLVDPDAEGPDPTDEQLARITARVTAGIAASPSVRRARVSRLRAAVILVVVACAAGGLAGVVASRDRGLHGRELVAASTGTPDLADLAEAARALPPPELGSPGREVVHVRLSFALRGDQTTRWRTETWAHADGTGRRTTTPEVAPANTEPTTQVFTEPGSLPLDGLDEARLARFEGTPEQLLHQIVRELHGSDPGGSGGDVSVAVAEVLAWPGTPPEVLGRLYEVLDVIGFRTVDADADTVLLEGVGSDEDRFTIEVDRRTVRPIAYRNHPGRRSAGTTDLATEVDLAAIEPEPG